MDNNQQNIIIYKTADGKASVALYAKDGNIWMNQNQLAKLFATSKQNISLHVINILKEGELSENSVVKDYLTTAADEALQADNDDLEDLKKLEQEIKSKKK